MRRALVTGWKPWAVAFAAALLMPACKSVPAPAAQAAPPPVISLDQKIGWVLRLEQQRTLRDPSVTPPPTPATTLQTASTPDLEALALDPNPFLRRRALLAIGRSGVPMGQRALMIGLQDVDADVRASAAFGLGLLGLPGALTPLQAALKDTSPVVRQRVIDAIGLVADRCTTEPSWCGLARPSGSAPVTLPEPFVTAASAVATAAGGCPTLVALHPPEDDGQATTPELELCRAAIFALVRLRQFDPLATLTLDAQARPVSYWWPVAYALQRHPDPRAASALLALASSDGVTTAAFAFRGLTTLKDARALPIAVALVPRTEADIKLRVAAVQLLGQIGGTAAVRPLLALLSAPNVPQPLLREVIAALGTAHDRDAFAPLLDYLTDPRPAIRAATLSAAAAIDPDAFLVVVAGLGRDADWSVRAALARAFATMPADRVTLVLEELAADEDARVHGPALESLAAVKAPTLTPKLFAALEAPDYVERSVAASLLGEARPDGGIARLTAAYARGTSDAAPDARTAALEALAKYGGAEAMAVVRGGLSDNAWPVRVRAAQLLTERGETAAPARPAPIHAPVDIFDSPALLHPEFSPHVFIETKLGTVEAELNVVDATMTARNFVELARAGFFNGLKIHRLIPNFVVQTGDPRGDGAGGPGYSIPDELSALPYRRGTMGMALDGRDTGGSQWFITLSPQPHLTGTYTVFGEIVAGWDVLDRLSQGDTIDRVRVWDGVTQP